MPKLKSKNKTFDIPEVYQNLKVILVKNKLNFDTKTALCLCVCLSVVFLCVCVRACCVCACCVCVCVGGCVHD